MLCYADLSSSSVDAGDVSGDIREWSLSFLRSPVEFMADPGSGRVSRVRLEINKLQVSNHEFFPAPFCIANPTPSPTKLHHHHQIVSLTSNVPSLVIDCGLKLHACCVHVDNV